MRTHLVLAILLATACGSSTTGTPDVDGAPNVPDIDAAPGTPDARPGSPDARPGAPDAAPTSSPDAAPQTPQIASCYKGCSSPSDCVVAGSTLFDADNWTCKSNLCIYNGCNNDSECQSAYMNTAYACRVTSQTGGTHQCAHTCTTSADCATAGVALYDANHWNCESTSCVYKGCLAASDCTTLGSNYTCADLQGSIIKSCQKTCSASADCVVAGAAIYDADNWSCPHGLCVWDGCNNDAECQSSLMNNAYVCSQPPQ
jgi:hypothetical protein